MINKETIEEYIIKIPPTFKMLIQSIIKKNIGIKLFSNRFYTLFKMLVSKVTVPNLLFKHMLG